MTLYSSRPPFNDDPLPWLGWDGLVGGGQMVRSDQSFGYAEHDPRPEFDRPQHNPTNPILTEFRKYAEDHEDAPRLAAHWTKSDVMWSEMCLKDYSFVEPIGTPAQEQHARRVLERLARLTTGAGDERR